MKFEHDSAITVGGQGGNFELNVMLPLMAYNLLQSIQWLGSAILAFAERCVTGITVNEKKCTSCLEQSLALGTSLVPFIGYDRAAALAKKAYETNKTIREVALEEAVLPEEQIHGILDKMIGE